MSLRQQTRNLRTSVVTSGTNPGWNDKSSMDHGSKHHFTILWHRWVTAKALKTVGLNTDSLQNHPKFRMVQIGWSSPGRTVVEVVAPNKRPVFSQNVKSIPKFAPSAGLVPVVQPATLLGRSASWDIRHLTIVSSSPTVGSQL